MATTKQYPMLGERGAGPNHQPGNQLFRVLRYAHGINLANYHETGITFDFDFKNLGKFFRCTLALLLSKKNAARELAA